MNKNINENFSKDDLEAISFNSNIRYLIEISNKRAWLISFVSCAISFLCIIAVCLLTPLKQAVPYVIRVDNVSGMVDIISKLDDEVQNITKNEAMDKYFVSNYVKLREQYYWNILEKDYHLVQVFSESNISDEYKKLYAGSSARQEVLKNATEVEISIISVVLSQSAGEKIATIRFNENIKNLTSKTNTASTKVATLSYHYVNDLKSERERIENPLGFKVQTYRIDSEIRR